MVLKTSVAGPIWYLLRSDKTYAPVKGRPKREQPKNLSRVLDAAGSQHCILWDEHLKRAGLPPAVSVLLYASVCCVLSKEYFLISENMYGGYAPASLVLLPSTKDISADAVALLEAQVPGLTQKPR